MKNTVVLYHKNCPDGFGAAWAAWKKFGSKAEYMPIVHQEPPPEGLNEKRIYLVDFTYPAPVLKEIIAKNKQVVGIDHHADRAEAIQLTHDYRFDPTHSGAVLAWQYFHPGKPTPHLLRHLEDQDLWRFILPHTKAITCALELMPFNFNKWNIIARDMQKAQRKKKYIAIGKIILDYKQKVIHEMTVQNSEKVLFEGHQTLALNFPPSPPFFVSELGHALTKIMPPIGIVWGQERGRLKFSLRSDGTIDVSALARKFGGGGHHDAAGFSLVSTDPLPWKPAN